MEDADGSDAWSDPGDERGGFLDGCESAPVWVAVQGARWGRGVRVL